MTQPQKTFQSVLKSFFDRFGMKDDLINMFLRVQELALIRDELLISVGIAGFPMFNEKEVAKEYYDGLRLIGNIQKQNRPGEFDGNELAILIPSVTKNQEINPDLLLPDTPQNIKLVANKLAETIMGKRGIETHGGTERI